MKEKVKIIGLTGKEREDAINLLSEDGKYEIVELNLSLRGEKYEAIIKVDFPLIQKGLAELISTNVTGNKQSQSVKVSVNDMGAGDLLLFQGWHEGDEAIRRKTALRVKASKHLGQWLKEYADKNEEEEGTEKKS